MTTDEALRLAKELTEAIASDDSYGELSNFAAGWAEKNGERLCEAVISLHAERDQLRAALREACDIANEANGVNAGSDDRRDWYARIAELAKLVEGK